MMEEIEDEIAVPDPFQTFVNSQEKTEEVTFSHPFQQFMTSTYSTLDDESSFEHTNKKPRYSGFKSRSVCKQKAVEYDAIESEDDDEHFSIGSINVPDIEVGDISDVSGILEDESNCEARKWDCFTESFGEKLYPGASITKMQAIAILTNWFSLHPGISKSAFNRLLNILHTHILPPGNTLPSGYNEAHKALEDFLAPTVEYHCCINDCVVFRDSETEKLAESKQCPKCFEPRYKEGSIPRKRFFHLPLESRLKRMFSQEFTARLFQEHLNENDVLASAHSVSTIHNTDTWKEWYSDQGIHKGDRKALSLGICSDGLNPFAKEKSTYSMWPIVIFPLNFPSSIRRVSSSMFLVGIIPGPKEMKNIDPYMSIVAEDIKGLNGMEVYDAKEKCTFKLKATVCLHVLDYPGQSKVFHSQGAGAYAGCAYCCQVGEYSKALDKMVYLEHRQFLPASDPLRLDFIEFPHKQVCHKATPEPKTQQYVDKENEQYMLLDSVKEKKLYAQKTGCTGSTPLRALPHHDRYLNTPVEPMHLIKGVAEHMVKLICGAEDSAKVRAEERVRNRFPSCWTNDSSAKSKSLPPAPFRLTNQDLKTVNERFKSICFPHGMDFKPTMTFGPSMHLKCIEWKHLMTDGILKYCLKGLLGNFQRKTLFELCDVLTELVAEEINLFSIDKLEYRTHRVLCLLERDFPVSLHVIVMHLLHHLPMYIKRFGPTYNFHMYPLERFNSWISRRVHNRRYPESTVIETYRLFELSSFLSASHLLPENSIDHIDNIIHDGMDVNTEWNGILDEHMFDKLKLFYQQRNASAAVDNVVINQKYVTVKDKHGREVRYSPCSHAARLSSCIVYFELNGTYIFGEVNSCFKHDYLGRRTVFARVSCFRTWYKEYSPSLLYVLKTEVSHDDVVDVQTLSKPLVHSYEGDKLWILNAPLCFFCPL